MNEASAEVGQDNFNCREKCRLTLKHVVLERADTEGEQVALWHPKELWIFGTPPPDEGKAYTLRESSPNRWEVEGSAMLPDAVDGVDCVIKSGEGKWIAFVHVDCNELRAVDVKSEDETRFEIESNDAKVRLIMSWRVEELPLKRLVQDHDLPYELNDYALAFIRRFDRTGDATDIDEAISALQSALDIAPEGNEDKLLWLIHLGNALARRFERLGNLADIERAIVSQTKAIELSQPSHPKLAGWYNNLGNSFQCMFERTGSLVDIDKAISAQKNAIALTAAGDQSLPIRLNNLGNSYQYRFERTGALADITEAISVQQQGVDLTPETHDSLPGRLNNLGLSFQARFESTGDLADLSQSVSVLQRAVHFTPASHAGLPARLTNLGNSFQLRFERGSDLLDLDEAINALNKAVVITPEDHPDLHGRLNNLGISCLSRYERGGDALRIDEAIMNLRRSVELTPDGHPKLPGRLSNLGSALDAHCESCGDPQYISESISAHQKSVELSRDGSPELPMRLNNLANSFMHRFKAEGSEDDLVAAVSEQRRSLELTPDSHASRPSRFKNLGTILYCKALSSNGTTADLKESFASFKAASMSIAGSPRIRLEAAISWAQHLAHHDPSSPDIICAYDTAIGLVSLIAGLEQTVSSRFLHLQKVSGLASEAAAVAFRLERPDKAVEWLEQGRCLVWNQLNSLRTPVEDLRILNPELAKSVLDVSAALEHSGSTRCESSFEMSLSNKISLEDEARSHLSLARKWEDLLTEIRAMPGFVNFLKPASFASLVEHLPKLGSVVVVNVDEQGCDGVVLRIGIEPLRVPLPNFSFKKATAYRDGLKSQLRSQGLRMRGGEADEADPFGEWEINATDDLFSPEKKDHTFEIGGRLSVAEQLSETRGLARFQPKRGMNETFVRTVLRDLWSEVVKPILDALEYTEVDAPSDKLPPRIWWCPTGPLSSLPVHAAGLYGSKESASILDYAVSSYTPTVTALTDRVTKEHPSSSNGTSGLILTCQPRAPGASPIPGTAKEINLLYTGAIDHGVNALKLEGDEVSAEECLAHMARFSNIHLACHGYQSATDPLKSRFLFHSGPLTLDQIVQSNLKNADLAFLSACQTSTGEDKLHNEAVHLAAGMLAAGYRRVIGTLWSITDRHAPDVARDFYQYLWSRRGDGSGDGFDGTLSAYALHHAIKELRSRLDTSEQSLLAWVPYVHFGS